VPSSADLARALIATLVERGVREVVLAPGSRSAPLAYAVFDAEQTGLLRLHVRLDERTAAFLALGLAKGSGGPVAVITTSGTAAANLHPAILEAWHSHLPLIAITADRPRALINTGANQTTQQDQLFAPHVRGSAQLVDAADLQGSRFEVSRLVTAALGLRSRLPGPVHLNVALSEPLIPEAGLEERALDRASAVVAALDDPVLHRTATTEFGTVHTPRPAEPLRLPVGPATVVLAGDADASTGAAAVALARQGGFPLLAEPSSNARTGSLAISTYRLLLPTRLGAEIQRVVVYGHPTLSRPMTALVADRRLELIVVSPYADWVDPGRHAHAVVDAVEADEADDLGWLNRWRDADARLRGELDGLLDDHSDFTGPTLARTVWNALGSDDVLVAGSSNPVRDLDLAPITDHPPRVFANRGLSGIDGTVSTAMGVALATGRPTHALIGDLTLLHDATGLFVEAPVAGERHTAAAQMSPRPNLRIVVANDEGGSIFATLEQGDPAYAAAFERVFATPQKVDLAALAVAVGAGYERADDGRQVAKLLANPPHGIEIVDARIDRTNRRHLDLAIKDLARALDA
jgi:2-succinyl-5-enolpyruvyl-6-hydroxy-3-cyclohexene-1-carboxylate synthase